MDGGLRKLFRDRITSAHWQSIESALTGYGIPDSNACKPHGGEVWVEFKQCKANMVHIKPGQVQWHERRARYGGRTFVAVRQQADAGAKRVARDVLWLLRGVACRPLIDRVGLHELQPHLICGQWQGGPAAWDWSAVERLLWPQRSAD